MRSALLCVLCFFTAAVVLSGQSDGRAVRVRALNNRLLDIRGQLRRASPPEAGSIRSEADGILRERARVLGSLIQEDAAGALELAFSTDRLADLAGAFPQSAPALESQGAWQGVLEYLIADDFETGRSTTTLRLRTAQEVLEIHLARRAPERMKSGDIVAVRGVRLGGQMAAADVSVLASAVEAAACSTTGQQSIVAILVDLPSYTLTSGVDQELVKGILFGNDYTSKSSSPNRSVDDFFRQNSDGRTEAPFAGGAVLGPYSLSKNYNKDASGATFCDSDGLKDEALAKADPEAHFPNYNRVMIVMPPNGACGWAGMGSVGCWSTSSNDGSFTASLVWLRSDQMTSRDSGVMLSTHELGHSLGMRHANSREFTVGGARVPLGPLGSLGTIGDYGDLFSTMGSWNFGFYNAPHAAQALGWLQEGLNYQVIETSGSYSVEPYENRPFGPKALKIRRGTGNDAWLWVEYRQNLGIYDSTLNPQVFTGALIHYEDSSTEMETHLLDFTPINGWTQVALAAGQSWQDPYSNLSITIAGATASALTASVSYGVAPCAQANPTVTLSPSNPSVRPGDSVDYTLSVGNKDSAGCSDATFSLSSSLPSGWPSTISPSNLTIGPGLIRTATMTKTAPSGAAPTTYPVLATATRGAYSMSGSATVTVEAVSPPSAPSNPSPANGATGVSLTPSLSWSASSGAASYDVYFGTSPSAPYVTNTTGTSYNPGTLASGTRYYWRVVAKNSGGSMSSPAWSFTPLGVPPAPGLSSPADGATGVSLTPSLSWSAAGGAASYDVYFGTSPSAPYVANTTGTSYNPGALAAGTTYRWRVVAKNSAGSTSSSTWSFTTLGVPAAPALRSPANGATGVSLTSSLSWSASSGAANYDLYFGTSSSPPYVANSTGTSYNPGALAAGTLYYWRVVAKNSAGSTSSATWSFTIVEIGPVISLSQPQLGFVAQRGGSGPPAKTVTIANEGTGTLLWSASSSVAWLSVTPSSGTAESTLSVSVNPAGLAVGSYSGSVTVSAAGAASQVINVILTVMVPQRRLLPPRGARQ